MPNERFYLNCPYAEKDECKGLGGRWDNQERKWYVPNNLDRNGFKQWWASSADTKLYDFPGN